MECVCGCGLIRHEHTDPYQAQRRGTKPSSAELEAERTGNTPPVPTTIRQVWRELWKVINGLKIRDTNRQTEIRDLKRAIERLESYNFNHTHRVNTITRTGPSTLP